MNHYLFNIRMKKRFSVVAFLLILMGVFAHSWAARRIISLSPSLTLNMRYLGDEADLVGCTSYCKTTRKIPVVASAIKVNVEKVVSMKPELVVASTMTPPETLEALKKVGINVVVFPIPHSFDEICQQFLQLGKLVGKEAQARKVIATSQQQVNKLKLKPGTKKMFIQLGANPLFAVIPNTFMNDYIRFLGAKNITTGMTSGSITREAVLARNPDVIFIVTMGIIASDEKKQWEAFPNLSAAINHKVVIIDSEKACMPTPVTFAETMAIIYKYAK